MHIAGSFYLVEPTFKSLLLPGTPFPREPVFRDVYVDDLAVLEIVETSKRAFAEDHLRMNRADDMHAALGMPIKTAGDGEFAGPIWGAPLDGQRRKLRFPMCRRATLAQAGAELLSTKTSGAPCTACPKSEGSTCADLGSQPPEHVFSAAWNALALPLRFFFSFVFNHKNIKLLEIESALSLLRHLASEGRRNCRMLALTDSRVALGALSKGRSSSRRVNYLLMKAAALCLCYGFQFDVV